MSKLSRYVTIVAIIFASTACSADQGNLESADPLVLRKTDSALEVALDFITPTMDEVIATKNPLIEGFSPEQEKSLDLTKEETLARYCGVDFESGLGLGVSGIGVVILTWIVGKVATFLLDSAQENIEKYLKEHVAQYSNPAKSYPMYMQIDGGVPVLAAHCLRFSKATKEKSQDRNIDVDLIAEIRIDTDAITIRPLRLYAGKTKAKSANAAKQDNGDIKFAFNLKADATWLEANRGRRSNIFDDLLFTESAKVNSDRVIKKIGNVSGQVKYYIDEASWEAIRQDPEAMIGPDWSNLQASLRDWSLSPRLPLIPWSPIEDQQGRFGQASLVMTVTETGVTPTFAKSLYGLLKDNKTAMANYLKKAFEEQLAPSE